MTGETDLSWNDHHIRVQISHIDWKIRKNGNAFSNQGILNILRRILPLVLILANCFADCQIKLYFLNRFLYLLNKTLKNAGKVREICGLEKSEP